MVCFSYNKFAKLCAKFGQRYTRSVGEHQDILFIMLLLFIARGHRASFILFETLLRCNILLRSKHQTLQHQRLEFTNELDQRPS